MGTKLLSALVVLAAAAAASADGIVVPGVAIVKPARTPDQRALLRFDGTSETLVIETTVQGEGRDFGWIVPLPAAPKIEASTTGLFPTLSLMCAPEVIDERAASKRGADGFGWNIVVALALGLWATVRWRRASPLVVAVLSVPVLFVLTGPGCGSGGPRVLRGGGESPQAVTVLSRGQVGAFDTATLEVRNPTALRAWLDANGFRAPDGIDDVVAAYVKDGWVFVASKLHRDVDDAAVHRVHPLAFTFPAKEAVYPMRLTGAANDSVALELYVVGDKRAEASGLHVERCDNALLVRLDPDAPTRMAETQYMYNQDERGELWRRCVGATVITKLSGVLDSAAMTRDLGVRWVGYERTQTTYVTDGVARRRARLPGAMAFAAVLLCGAVVAALREYAAARSITLGDVGWLAAALVVGATAAVSSYSREPRLPAGASVADGWARGDDASDLLSDPPTSVFGDAAALRAWARSKVEGRVNPFTGGPRREEDSPGNWFVREENGRLELVVVESPFSSRARDVSRYAPLEGTVRAADGEPVAGASVRLTYRSFEPVAGEFFPYTIRTDTDERGRWRLDVPVGRAWHVSVVHDDHPYLLRRDVDMREPPKTMDLALPKERTIRGRVLDAGGRPRAGVVVAANRKSPFTTNANESRATTGADGAFEFKGFDAEAAEVRFHLHVEPKPWDSGEDYVVRPGDPPVELRDDD